MKNFRETNGSISMLVLASCMFFIASVMCVQMYMQSKQSSVSKEYNQIKSNYEKSLENIDTVYSNLANIHNIIVNFETPNINTSNNKIYVNTEIDTTNFDSNDLKYGWLYSKTELQELDSKNISEWTYFETKKGVNKFTALKNYTNSGYYYLCIVINNSEKWINHPVHIS